MGGNAHSPFFDYRWLLYYKVDLKIGLQSPARAKRWGEGGATRLWGERGRGSSRGRLRSLRDRWLAGRHSAAASWRPYWPGEPLAWGVISWVVDLEIKCRWYCGHENVVLSAGWRIYRRYNNFACGSYSRRRIPSDNEYWHIFSDV
jgi:hypothetical protein